MKKAVFIGKLQVIHLTNFHIKLLKTLEREYDKITVFLCSSEVKGSRLNPFSFLMRKQMLEKEFPDFEIIKLPNAPTSSFWSDNIDEILDKETTNSLLIYGENIDVLATYSGKYPKQEIATYAPPSTDNLNHQTVFPNGELEFRKGVLFAYQKMYPKVYPTVDIAVFKENKKYLLLGRKRNDNRWRFPGGFVDPTDRNYEAAAKREMQEECGNLETSEMQYEGSIQIDDWRYRAEVDKIITTLFSTDYSSGAISASDDLAELQWFELAAITSELVEKQQLNPEHIALFQHLEDKYLNN